jgi:predicted exporter
MLGFSPAEAAAESAAVRAAYSRADFTASKPAVTPDTIPPYLKRIVSNLWLGEVDGTYYSCVLPLHARDETIFRSIAHDMSARGKDEAARTAVLFVNKVKDIGVTLDSLTKLMLILLSAAYLIILILIKTSHRWKDTLKIGIAPLLLILVTLTVLAALDIPIGFFSAVGLILVFGLGLDYMFYITDNAASPLTILAIILSFATTALSFGALSLSTFMPVHIFGLTVFSGLSAAFVCSMLLAHPKETP